MLPQHVHGGRVGQWTCMSRVHGWFDTLGFDESLDNARVWGRLDPVFQVAPCEDDSGARAGVREIGSLKEGCTKQGPSVSHRVSRQRPCWCVCVTFSTATIGSSTSGNGLASRHAFTKAARHVFELVLLRATTPFELVCNHVAWSFDTSSVSGTLTLRRGFHLPRPLHAWAMRHNASCPGWKGRPSK